MDEFLDMLGQRIDLSEHRGYKGGLDTVHGQTGQHSVYQVLGGAYIISLQFRYYTLHYPRCSTSAR